MMNKGYFMRRKGSKTTRYIIKLTKEKWMEAKSNKTKKVNTKLKN